MSLPQPRFEAEEPSLARAREEMLRLIGRNVRDQRVIDAMAAVRREDFVPPGLRGSAYDDRALPIGYGQTISQPLIVALILDPLRLTADDRALEVGTGSGYQAALLSELVREVISVERLAPLADRARAALAEAGCRNTSVHAAGDVLGWPAGAPYQAIVVAAAAPHVPRALIEQLGDGGRLVLPVGSRSAQELVRVTRTSYGLELTRLGPCAFVPLIGDGGWRE